MNIRFDVIEDENHNIKFTTDAEGNDVIHTPLLNKGTAFTKTERDRFGLNGLIPPRILTLEQQIDKIHQRYIELGKALEISKSCTNFDEKNLEVLKKDIDIARYNFLRDLQDRNELLFYAFTHRYMKEVIPIIYTPTVGDAVIRYSRDSVRFRGFFLSPSTINEVESAFDHFRFKHPSIAVVTDNQGILGLGDQGVGGIDIPIGKLALYVLGAGIQPWETLPVTLDVGTDNTQDLTDPYYLGYKDGRLLGPEYDNFIEKFIDGIKTKFPDILVQWEDFSKQNAFTILDKYRHQVLSFNDDIQGTGAMALAGILNALKCSGEEFKDQRFVIYGAGAGGIGIARQIATSLESKCNLSKEAAYDHIVALDSRGMIINQRDVEEYKKPFSKISNFYNSWDIENISHIGLLEVIKNFRPTVLIGTSGCPGHFTKNVIYTMAKNTERPVIFPLSNPTYKAEATPEEIYKYTKGKAIVATGSPFQSFEYNGKTVVIGQGNNFFIFPGVGLGAIISKGNYISDAVFTEAAYILSELTPKELINRGTVYPPITDIRNISAHIAFTTIHQIAQEQNTLEYSMDDIKSMMWEPGYHPIIKCK
jgi:malate dehydrogenase (oxaloacetate-decarboxylating)